MKVKLSIIIPVYNTEHTLARCIDSCLYAFVEYLDQIEIIIINDGSIDNPYVVVSNYLIKYPNIAYYSQENLGLSRARNKGLAISQGEYIWCVDSDDTIYSDCAKLIFNALEKSSDVYALGYSMVDSAEGKIISENLPIPGSLNGKSLLRTYQQPIGAPFYIIKREYLAKNNLKFYEGIYHEDNLFNFLLLYNAGSVDIIESLVYKYYQYNTGTITSTPSLKRSIDLLFISEYIFNFLSQNASGKDLKIYSDYIGLCLTSALANIKKCNREDRQVFFKKVKSKFSYLISLFKICRLKYLLFLSYLLIKSLSYVKK